MYCGDKNIADGLILSVLSLTEQVKEPLGIYVLTAGIKTCDREFFPLEERTVAGLDRLVKSNDPDSFVRLTDISGLFSADPPKANMATRFTPCCMLRLYADLVDGLPDRILYLDNDVVCRKDISKLYGADLSEAEFAGVKDYYGKWFFRRNIFKTDYINSGVLLLNMAKIKETGLFARCRDLCREKEMFMPDQSSLNRLAQSKVFLPRRFNEQRRLKKDTVLQHFTTHFRLWPYFHAESVKPWQKERMHSILKLHEYDRLLESFEAYKIETEKEFSYE